MDDARDPERETPLAALHLANFKEVGEILDQKWFQRADVEQLLVKAFPQGRGIGG